eukprot:PhM_4_TR10094/c3_g2_i2/m.19655
MSTSSRFDMIFACFAADEIRTRALVLSVMFSRFDGRNRLPFDTLEHDGILDFAIARPAADYVDLSPTGMKHILDCYRAAYLWRFHECSDPVETAHKRRDEVEQLLVRSVPYNTFHSAYLLDDDQTLSLEPLTFQALADVFKIVLPLAMTAVKGRAVCRAMLGDGTGWRSELAPLHLCLCRALSLVPPQFWYDASKQDSLSDSSDDDDDEAESSADSDDDMSDSTEDDDDESHDTQDEHDNEAESNDDDTSDSTDDNDESHDTEDEHADEAESCADNNDDTSDSTDDDNEAKEYDETKGCKWSTLTDPDGLQQYLPEEPTVGSFIHIPVCFGVLHNTLQSKKMREGDVRLYFTRVRGVVMDVFVSKHDTLMVQGPASFRVDDVVDKRGMRRLYLEQVSTDFSVHTRLVSPQSAEFDPHNFDIELMHASSHVSFASRIDLRKEMNVYSLHTRLDPEVEENAEFYDRASWQFGRYDIAHLVDGRDMTKRDLLIEALRQDPGNPDYSDALGCALGAGETVELPDGTGTIRTMTAQDLHAVSCTNLDNGSALSNLAFCLGGDDTATLPDGTQWTSSQLCIKAAELFVKCHDFRSALQCIAQAACIHRFDPGPMKDLEGRLGFPTAPTGCAVLKCLLGVDRVPDEVMWLTVVPSSTNRRGVFMRWFREMDWRYRDLERGVYDHSLAHEVRVVRDHHGRLEHVDYDLGAMLLEGVLSAYTNLLEKEYGAAITAITLTLALLGCNVSLAAVVKGHEMWRPLIGLLHATRAAALRRHPRLAKLADEDARKACETYGISRDFDVVEHLTKLKKSRLGRRRPSLNVRQKTTIITYHYHYYYYATRGGGLESSLASNPPQLRVLSACEELWTLSCAESQSLSTSSTLRIRCSSETTFF